MRNIIIVMAIVFSLAGAGYSTHHNLPLGEEEAKHLMSEQMDIHGWKFSVDGDQYIFSSKPSDPNVDGLTYIVNSNTGTVYDSTSGGPDG